MKKLRKYYRNILHGEELALVAAHHRSAEYLFELYQETHDTWIPLQKLKWQDTNEAFDFLMKLYASDDELGFIILHKNGSDSNGRFIGIALMNEGKDESVCNLNAIAMHKDFERKGYSSQALVIVENAMRDVGYSKIKLSCHESNKKAIGFFEKNQYTTIEIDEDDLRHGIFREYEKEL